MTWIFENKPYSPGNERSIVYRMTYKGMTYIGKKTVKDKAGKPTKYKSYYGSGKRWLEFIKGNESHVKREVVYICANLVEASYFENYLLYSSHAIFSDTSCNDNVSMLANRRNTKNFINKPEAL